jgi:hypothetical protein
MIIAIAILVASAVAYVVIRAGIRAIKSVREPQ